MIKYFTFLTFIFLSCHSFAQDNTVILKGRIVADSLKGSSIHILNLTKGSGTNNSPNGDFEITVREHDTLSFSSIQFESPEVVITKKIMIEGYLIVELKEIVNNLEEVYLSNLSLSGNLSVDIAQLPVFNQADFGFPITKRLSIEERRLKSAQSGAMNFLFNYFSGKTDYLNKIKKIEQQKGLVEKGIEAVPKTYFTERLHIPENLIRDFIYYCMENPNFHILLEPQRGLDLIEYYQMKAPKYLKHKAGI